MKKMNQLLFFIILLFGIILCGINIYLSQISLDESGREYRVSINRIEKALDEYEAKKNTTPQNLDELEQFAGVGEYKHIVDLYVISKDAKPEELSEFLTGENEDYAIIDTDSAYYRVAYDIQGSGKEQLLLVVNVIAVILFLCVLAFWLYVRNKILKPFYRLSEVPFELSKGNLTVPLQENKDKFFGRFVWGMDLLRENLEENRAKELEIQKEKKLLLLSLSHDIKTPLSAIKLYAKALSRNLYKDEAKKLEIASNIDEKVDEIEGYISDIVKASNEDFLHFDVENGEFYIKDVLEQIRDYYQDKMQLNQIDFDMGKYSNCLVYGDKDRLVEVIQNIIENAIKYGDGKRIWLEMQREEEEYVIRISNTGCQLEDKELPHIFDSFFRGSNVDKKPGSGLGLYICRQLMHLMEGEIAATVISQEQSGEGKQDVSERSQEDLMNQQNKSRVMMVQVAVRLA